MPRRCLFAVGRGPRRCALRNSTNQKSSLSVDFRSFVCAPAAERNTLSVPSMCHPEQAKRVEPQAKRRGGCRVSGRRDLSWSYGCFLLRSHLAVPASVLLRSSTTGVPPSAQDDTQTVHLRNPYDRVGFPTAILFAPFSPQICLLFPRDMIQ